jgi:hypothetical protein
MGFKRAKHPACWMTNLRHNLRSVLAPTAFTCRTYPLDYPFALIKVEGSEHTDRVIVAPGLSRFQGHNAYVLMAYGFEWIFIVSSHSHKLPRNYPFVGLKKELVVFVEFFNKQEFLRRMRKQMSKLI